MKRLVFAAMLVALLMCIGCNSLMHKTIAEQVVRMDKNCITLLTQYKNVLLHADFPGDPEHEMALLEATLILSADLRKSAEMVIDK